MLLRFQCADATFCICLLYFIPFYSERIKAKFSVLQTDADYWLLSDAGVSITDMWKTARIL